MSTLTIKGQVTIPVHLRRELGLTSGSRLKFTRINNEIKITPAVPADDIAAVFGLLKSKRSVSLRDMRRARSERTISRFQKSIG